MSARTNQDHSRFRAINVHDCRQMPPDENAIFPVVIYMSAYKLRAHALNHFANLTETQWDVFRGASYVNTITRIRDALIEIGCPGVKLSINARNCISDGQKCPCYNHCTEIVRELETDYVNAVRTVMEHAGQTPRHLGFSDSNAVLYCWMMSDHRIKVVLTWVKNWECYNVNSAYYPAGRHAYSFQELIDFVRRRAAQEALPGSLAYCTDNNWGMNPDPPEDRGRGRRTRDTDKPSKNQKKSKKTKRYFSGSSQSVRQYLEQYAIDDDI